MATTANENCFERTNEAVSSPKRRSRGSNASEIEEAISVYVRVRPLNQRECSTTREEAWSVSNDCCTIATNDNFLRHTFDGVFGSKITTPQVYDSAAKELVSSVLRGMNGTIFAYGQTASGKTFTMQGEAERLGILELAANQVFEEIRNREDFQFMLHVSYVEVYNEQVKDLLSDGDRAGSMRIREGRDKGFFVDNLTMKSIVSPHELLAVKEEGELRRHVGETNMNERSSRSHTIFTLKIEMRDSRVVSQDFEGASLQHTKQAKKGRKKKHRLTADDYSYGVLVGTLNLVDLAGSENARATGAEGGRLKEGGNINRSLLTLSRVISQLASAKQGQPLGFVNWRDSKLTQILQPSLAGNCRTAIICCISPANTNVEESKSTLSFAARAKQIRTRACVNEIVDGEGEMRKLKKTIQDLRLELASQKEVNDEKTNLQNKIRNLKALLLTGGSYVKDNDDFAAMDSTDTSAPRVKRRRIKQRETWGPGNFPTYDSSSAFTSVNAKNSSSVALGDDRNNDYTLPSEGRISLDSESMETLPSVSPSVGKNGRKRAQREGSNRSLFPNERIAALEAKLASKKMEILNLKHQLSERANMLSCDIESHNLKETVSSESIGIQDEAEKVKQLGATEISDESRRTISDFFPSEENAAGHTLESLLAENESLRKAMAAKEMEYHERMQRLEGLEKKNRESGTSIGSLSGANKAFAEMNQKEFKAMEIKNSVLVARVAELEEMMTNSITKDSSSSSTSHDIRRLTSLYEEKVKELKLVEDERETDVAFLSEQLEKVQGELCVSKETSSKLSAALDQVRFESKEQSIKTDQLVSLETEVAGLKRQVLGLQSDLSQAKSSYEELLRTQTQEHENAMVECLKKVDSEKHDLVQSMIESISSKDEELSSLQSKLEKSLAEAEKSKTELLRLVTEEQKQASLAVSERDSLKSEILRLEEVLINMEITCSQEANEASSKAREVENLKNELSRVSEQTHEREKKLRSEIELLNSEMKSKAQEFDRSQNDSSKVLEERNHFASERDNLVAKLRANEDKIDKLEEDNNLHKEILTKVRDELCESQTLCSELERKCREQEQSDQLLENTEKLESTVDSLNKRIGAIMDESERNESIREDLEYQCEHYRVLSTRFEEELTQRIRLGEALQEQLEEMEKFLSEAKTAEDVKFCLESIVHDVEIAVLKEESDMRTSHFKQSISSHENDLATSRSRIAQLQSDAEHEASERAKLFDALEEERKRSQDLQQCLKETECAAHALRSELEVSMEGSKDLLCSNESLKRKVKELEKEIDLSSQNMVSKEKLLGMQTALKALENKIVFYEKEIEEKNKSISHSTEKLYEMRCDLDLSNRSIAENQLKVSQLQEQMKESSAAFLSVEKDLSESRDRNAELVTDLQSKNTQISQYSEELNALKNKLHSIEDKSEMGGSSSDTKDRLCAAELALEESKRRSEDICREFSASIEASKIEIENLKDENQSLRHAKNHLEDDLSLAHERIEKLERVKLTKEKAERINQLKEDHRKLKSQYADALSENETLLRTQRDLKNRLAAQDESGNLGDMGQNSSYQMQQLNARLDSLAELVGLENTDRIQMIDNLLGRLQELVEDRQALQTKCQEYDSRLRSYASNVADSSTSHNEKISEIELTLAHERKEMQNKLEDLEAKLETERKQVVFLETENLQIMVSNRKLKEDLAKLNRSNSNGKSLKLTAENASGQPKKAKPGEHEIIGGKSKSKKQSTPKLKENIDNEANSAKDIVDDNSENCNTQ